jgi:hypothetical protein
MGWARAAPIWASPPLLIKAVLSPKADFSASQKVSVKELPVTPEISEFELGMTLPFWT